MKHKLTSLFSIPVLTAMLLQSGIPCFAEPLPPEIEEGTYGVLEYNLVDSQYIVLTGCEEGVTEFEIPVEIDSYPVLEIEASNFSSPSLTAITVEEGHKHFSSVDGVLFDASGKQLYRYPFGKGKSYAIPEGTLYIEHGAFMGLDAEGNVNDTLTEIVFPESLLKIGYYAFSGCCGLTSVTFPDACTYLGPFAFSDCMELESISFGESLGAFQSNTFENCPKLAELTVNNSRYLSVKDGVLYSKDGKTLELYPPAREAAVYTVPDGVTRIRGGAFSHCNSLEEVIFPESLEDLDGTTFFHCPLIKSITIPEGTTSMSTICNHCESFETLYLPSTIDFVDFSAIRNCPNITDVYYNGSKAMWENVDNSQWLSKTHTVHYREVTVYGDLNGNDGVDVLDCVLLQKFLLGKYKADANQYTFADLNGDGTVNAFDLAILKSMLLSA